MPCLALVDCNAFYVSCERLFAPALRCRAVVVLSNNDGCVIARSPEAKALPVAMGAAAFTLRPLIAAGRLIACSSNYALYGDLSQRVMQTLAGFGQAQEVYSIDECFLDLGGDRDPVVSMAAARRTVARHVGIPVSVGIAATKTLAKLAGSLAKNRPDGVCRLPPPGPQLAQILGRVAVDEVWGVGRRTAAVLHAAGLRTALDLARASPARLRSRFGLVGERLVRELRGEACHGLVADPPPQQHLTVSRSFAGQISDRDQIRAAVATFAQRAAAKARSRHLAASALNVWLAAHRFDPGAPACSGAATRVLPVASNHGGELVGHAVALADGLWTPQGRWKQAGVTLLDLVDDRHVQQHLFDDPRRPRWQRLDDTVDAVNQRYGRQTLRQATTLLGDAWQSLSAHRSLRATTCWDELVQVG